MEYKRIRELREDNDKTQQQISMILNITQQQYQLYESGRRTIPSDYLPKLAIFYNTSIDYLLRTNKSKITLSSCEYEHKKISVIIKRLFCAMIFFYKVIFKN